MSDTGLYPVWQPPVDPKALGRPKGLDEPEVMTLASNPSPEGESVGSGANREPIYEALWVEFKAIGVTI